jgi:hypothetical protein
MRTIKVELGEDSVLTLGLYYEGDEEIVEFGYARSAPGSDHPGDDYRAERQPGEEPDWRLRFWVYPQTQGRLSKARHTTPGAVIAGKIGAARKAKVDKINEAIYAEWPHLRPTG